MFQRYLGLVTVLLFSSLTVLAQNGALHGTVKDDQGNKVELVTVAVEGTSLAPPPSQTAPMSWRFPQEPNPLSYSPMSAMNWLRSQ